METELAKLRQLLEGEIQLVTDNHLGELSLAPTNAENESGGRAHRSNHQTPHERIDSNLPIVRISMFIPGNHNLVGQHEACNQAKRRYRNSRKDAFERHPALLPGCPSVRNGLIASILPAYLMPAISCVNSGRPNLFCSR